MDKNVQKKTVLIADDSKMNQELLSEILGDKYNYVYADDGVQAIEVLNSECEIDIVLLDINMPIMDGFEVLEIIKKYNWTDEIPIIVISAETESSFLQRAYDLGAIAYIAKPYDAITLRYRVENSLKLYERQKRLITLVEQQVYEREKINNMIINIFSHTIESRNSESGNHTLHMQTITNKLLRQLINKTDKYNLSETDISMISTVSALHDIGKITVPESILNKPGKLNEEEWEIMKSHTVKGDEFLDSMPDIKTEKFMITAHEICRWHHERYDGSGYPDGLKGDDIPITAQIVALADVYDALTSERCYKAAFSHEKAMRMILDGECGAFNPILLECLEEIGDDLLVQLNLNIGKYDYLNESINVAKEILDSEKLAVEDERISPMKLERIKKEFFAKNCGGIQFEYDRQMKKVIYIHRYNSDGEKVLLTDDAVSLLNQADISTLIDRTARATRENPIVTMKALVPIDGQHRWHKLTVETIWPLAAETYDCIIGCFKDIHDEITKEGLEILEKNKQDFSYDGYLMLKDIFSVVRMVDPESQRVLAVNDDGTLTETETKCYSCWGRNESCKNCVSAWAMQHKKWAGKFEIKDGQLYSVLARYQKIMGRECVLEIAFRLDTSFDETSENTAKGQMPLYFYKDAITNSYSRKFLEDFFPNLENADGVAIADIDSFKSINDNYGHIVGDAALKHISEVIASQLGERDALIRYGGDEFLIIFNDVSKDEFYTRLTDIQQRVRETVFETYPGLNIGISIGGAFKAESLAEAIALADKEMYKDKNNRKVRI